MNFFFLSPGLDLIRLEVATKCHKLRWAIPERFMPIKIKTESLWMPKIGFSRDNLFRIWNSWVCVTQIIKQVSDLFQGLPYPPLPPSHRPKTFDLVLGSSTRLSQRRTRIRCPECLSKGIDDEVVVETDDFVGFWSAVRIVWIYSVKSCDGSLIVLSVGETWEKNIATTIYSLRLFLSRFKYRQLSSSRPTFHPFFFLSLNFNWRL